MSIVTMSEFFPYFNETISLKKILTHNNRWFDYDDVIKGFHFSKSPAVLLQYLETWAVKKFANICSDMNVTVDFLNKILNENFSADKLFVNDHGVYQLMIGSTRSPSNSVRNWYIREALRPEEYFPQLCTPKIIKLKRDEDHENDLIKNEHISIDVDDFDDEDENKKTQQHDQDIEIKDDSKNEINGHYSTLQHLHHHHQNLLAQNSQLHQQQQKNHQDLGKTVLSRKQNWNIELKIPYELDTKLVVRDKYNNLFRLVRY